MGTAWTAQVPAGATAGLGGGGPPGTFVDFAPLHLLTIVNA